MDTPGSKIAPRLEKSISILEIGCGKVKKCFSPYFQGHLYAVGGNGGITSLDTCERYDPHLNKWIVLAPMNKRRAGAGVAILNGYLYAVGKHGNRHVFTIWGGGRH
jgi:hypothetical protein